MGQSIVPCSDSAAGLKEFRAVRQPGPHRSEDTAEAASRKLPPSSLMSHCTEREESEACVRYVEYLVFDFSGQ